MDLTCPKCHGSMRTYERNGVHVDQCTECRGIFLDRGELERLVDAEARWADGPDAAPAPAAQQPSGQRPSTQQSVGGMVGEVLQQVRAQQSGGHGGQYQQPYRGKKKSSFLGELFG